MREREEEVEREEERDEKRIEKKRKEMVVELSKFKIILFPFVNSQSHPLKPHMYSSCD